MSPDAGPTGYDPRAYPPVAVTVDIVVLTLVDRVLNVLLVRRGGAPYAGWWALPGGFIHPDESLDAAAARELREETGVDAAEHLEQFGAYGDPERDPRMRVVTVGYWAVLRDVGELHAGTDATHASLVRVADVMDGDYRLAFDHGRILDDGIAVVRDRLERTSLATAFVGPEFTLGELRSVYESAWETPVDPANFRRKMLQIPGLLKPTGRRLRRKERGKPAEVFTAGDVQELDPPFRLSSPGTLHRAMRFAGEPLTEATALSVDGVFVGRTARTNPRSIATTLTSGPRTPLRDVEANSSAAGLFLIWYRDEPLFLGHSRLSSEAEGRRSSQPEGVRGRLRGIRRQPTSGIRRALGQFFPDDVGGPEPDTRAVAMALERHGECRYVELPSGQATATLVPKVEEALEKQGVIPLTRRLS